MSARPNLLVIQADQFAAPASSVYGGFAHTPALEALAGRGTLFSNAYCNYPLCAPSRFSMLTGLMPFSIGAFDNAAELPASMPTVVHYLRRAGYRTCLSGKMHFIGPDQLHGFEERVTTDIYPADFAWLPNWETREQGFEPRRTDAEIRLSQARRGLVSEALSTGLHTPWDFEPRPDYSRLYVRGRIGSEAVDRRIRIRAKRYPSA